VSKGNPSINGIVDGWQSLALTRQNLSLEAHLHDTNLNLDLLSAPPLSPVFATHPRPQWGKRVTSKAARADGSYWRQYCSPLSKAFEYRICLSIPFFAWELWSQPCLRFRLSAETRDSRYRKGALSAARG